MECGLQRYRASEGEMGGICRGVRGVGLVREIRV